MSVPLPAALLMTLQAPTLPQPTHAVSRLDRVFSYRWFLLWASGVLAFDQLTKYAIYRTLPLGAYGPPLHREVIPGFFNLVHVGNTGAAWSLFTGSSMALAVLAIATLAAIFYYRRSLGLRHPMTQVSFGLLCGGILGNLIDRLIHGHVIDFLDFHFGSYVYPTFNLADSGICVGVLLYLWQSLREKKSVDAPR